MIFLDHTVAIRLYPAIGTVYNGELALEISCKMLDWQLSALAQVCSSFVPSLSTLETLDISEIRYQGSKLQDKFENTQWLELLHPFTAVKVLYASARFGPKIAHTLQELTEERVTEVLPVVRRLFLAGFRSSRVGSEAMGPFITARQRFGHPVAVHYQE